MQTITIPKELFSMLKRREINKDEYLILSFRYLSNKWPDRQTALNKLNLVNSSYYKALKRCVSLWDVYRAFQEKID